MKQRASQVSHGKKGVTVSIGIPAYNEDRNISQLLHAILKQSTKGFTLREVIVNVSGSTDNTEARVKAIASKDSRVKLISTGTRSGKASALNDIVERVKGDLVLLFDADIVLEENCISSLITPLLQNESVGVCSGNIMPLKGSELKDFFEFASLFIRELHHELCLYLVDKGLTPKVNGTFFAFRAGIVNSFPNIVVSDDEYVSYQAQKKGYKVAYVPNALVLTRDPHSFRDFIKWQKRILAGQFYMKRHFGYEVPTMRTSVLVNGGMLKLAGKYQRKLLSLLTLGLLGALSLVLAYIEFAKGDIPYIY